MAIVGYCKISRGHAHWNVCFFGRHQEQTGWGEGGNPPFDDWIMLSLTGSCFVWMDHAESDWIMLSLNGQTQTIVRNTEHTLTSCEPLLASTPPPPPTHTHTNHAASIGNLTMLKIVLAWFPFLFVHQFTGGIRIYIYRVRLQRWRNKMTYKVAYRDRNYKQKLVKLY